MNTCSRWPERGLASGTSSRRVVATDGCPVSSFLGVRQAAPAQHGEFSLLVADAHCLLVGLLLAGQSRPYPRGGTMATSSSRSRSTMACKAAAVGASRRLSGKTSYQAAYSACRASSPATRSFRRCERENDLCAAGGRRHVEVTDRHAAADYAKILKDLS